jgi:hypothetical protein
MKVGLLTARGDSALVGVERNEAGNKVFEYRHEAGEVVVYIHSFECEADAASFERNKSAELSNVH